MSKASRKASWGLCLESGKDHSGPVLLPGLLGARTGSWCDLYPISRWQRDSPTCLSLVKSASDFSVWPGLWVRKGSGT